LKMFRLFVGKSQGVKGKKWGKISIKKRNEMCEPDGEKRFQGGQKRKTFNGRASPRNNAG